MLLLAGFLLALVAASAGWSPRRSRWASASPGRSRCPWALVALVAVVAALAPPRPGDRLPRGEAVSMVAVLAACGRGRAGWPAIAWWRTGVRSAYTDTMATWRVDRRGDAVPAVAGHRPLPRRRHRSARPGWRSLVVVLVLWCWARGHGRSGPQLRAWCLAYPAYLGAVLDPWTSIFRYAAAALPARRRPRRRRLGPARRRAGCAGAPGCSSWPGWCAGLVGLGAVPVRAAVGLPAVTVLRAVAPVRALRDRVLSWPTWACCSASTC